MNDILLKLNFEGNEIHELKWKGKPCWIAIDVARAAGLGNPSRAISQYIKKEDWLEQGEIGRAHV